MALAAAGSEASSSSTVIFVILSCTQNLHKWVSVGAKLLHLVPAASEAVNLEH